MYSREAVDHIYKTSVSLALGHDIAMIGSPANLCSLSSFLNSHDYRRHGNHRSSDPCL